MLSTIQDFFGMMGITAPQNLGEMVLYIIHTFVGVALVSGVFGVIKSIARAFSPRGW